MRVVIAGSTGFIGSALTDALKKEGHEVIPLVRRPPSPGEARWDPETGEIDTAALEGAGIAVNLAGESITGRWTAAKKQRIRDSRIKGTKLLATTLTGLNAPPKAFLCASAVGIYGDRGDEELTDSSPPGAGFLAETGKEWEEAANHVNEAVIRVVHLRLGIVLDKDGGALKQMLTPFRLGFGGTLGSGRQYMSWVTREDAVRAILHLIEDESISGPVNVVSPNPCTNQEFTKVLGAILHRPVLIPVPAFGLRLLFGEMADEGLLASVRVLPKRLEESGFRFNHPDLGTALRHALA